MNIVSMPEQVWAFLSSHSQLPAHDINAAVAKTFDEVNDRLLRSQVRMSGPPRAHFRFCDGARVDYDVGVPIHPDDASAARDFGLQVGETLVGEALLHIHQGPYAELGRAYGEMEHDLHAKGLKGRGDLWEVYLNDPDECPPSALLTEILWPIASRNPAAERKTAYEGIS